MRLKVPAWTAVARLDEPSPIVVPPASVTYGSDSCGAESPAGSVGGAWVCTRRAGHTARHAAAITTGEVLAVWP